MKNQNNKKIIFGFIVIFTLILFYGIRRNEEYNELIQNEKKENILSINKLLKGQIEDDIFLNNSKLLNIRVSVDDIKKTIIKEEMEKENNDKNNNQKYEIQLWMIETFFLTLFCIIIGGLYFYGIKKENETKNNFIKKVYMNKNQDYYLAESEMEYLINKGEIENYYNKMDEE